MLNRLKVWLGIGCCDSPYIMENYHSKVCRRCKAEWRVVWGMFWKRRP